MNESKSVKALKKQMAAAIAMVTVAAVALGSSTYAWFVSNNSVKATTSTISAQSNSAYMVIKYNEKTGADSKTMDQSTITGPTALYPAQVVDNGVWQSAFASSSGASAENTTTRFTIKSNGQTDGSKEAAVAEHYAMKETFYIGAKIGEFENLKVTGVTVNNSDSKLENAMRVMVVCTNNDTTNWVVYDGTGKKVTIEGEKTDEILATSIKHNSDTDNGDVKVDAYVYYDGADDAVYTDNAGMFDGKIGLTITFGATNKDVGGSGQVSQDQNAAPTTPSQETDGE